MKFRSAAAACLVASVAAAQSPAPAPPIPTADPPAAKAGLFAKVCDNLQACRHKLCATPAGQLLNGVSKPISALTGGVVPTFCPQTPDPADLKDGGAVGAAAKLAADNAGVKKRVAAVRALAGVDCRYWPEAEEALVAAVRGDRVECVRYEAAVVLSQGCCCTKKVVEALATSVSGLETDGSPAERSVRVRCAAAAALDKCVAACGPGSLTLPLSSPNPAPPTNPATPNTIGRATAPDPAAVARAGRTLAAFRMLLAAADGRPVPAEVVAAAAPTPPRILPAPAAVVPASAVVLAPPRKPPDPPAPPKAFTAAAANVRAGATAADRHAAVRELVGYDARRFPEVPVVLLAGAVADPESAVRVDCVRHLAAYGLAGGAVGVSLRKLAAADPDPWVRDEAAKAAGGKTR